MKTILLPVAVLFIFLSSCDVVEIGQAKDVNPDAVWQQYNIWYDEADDSVICHAQFRFAGPNGTSLVLDSASHVMLDGKLLDVDSSIYPGAYYLHRLLPQNAIGKHVFSYTDINGKNYQNAFIFSPLQLQNDLPVSINRHSDLKLRFSGLADKELLAISLSDTATDNSADIDSNFALKSQCIIIPATYLAKMANGPLTLHIGYDKKLPLQQTAKEGGEINFSYSLKPREILLSDSWE